MQDAYNWAEKMVDMSEIKTGMSDGGLIVQA